MRDPSADRNPLDRASFYVEALKFGVGHADVEPVTEEGLVAQLETLLRDAGVTSMTGAELSDALAYYYQSLATSFRIPALLAGSCFVDGLMHGIALAGGLEGKSRDDG